MKRKEKNYRTKCVNPKLITNEISLFKILNLQVILNKSSLNPSDWRNHSNYVSNNYSYKVDMDAKISHRKNREGD